MRNALMQLTFRDFRGRQIEFDLRDLVGIADRPAGGANIRTKRSSDDSAGFRRHVTREAASELIEHFTKHRRPKGTRYESLHSAARCILSLKGSLRIVQIGVNDGKLNDPIYPIVRRYPSQTSILLIEPLCFVIPILKENYAFHPDFIVHEAAIGPAGLMTLYRVGEEFWSYIDAPYAQRWPVYRAPTGVTSALRSHVEEWVGKFLKPDAPIDDPIEEIAVRSSPLEDVLNFHRWPTEIDILQIDTEGLDDVVIYNSSIEKTKPVLIHFEVKHLSDNALNSLECFLVKNGYELHNCGDDSIATRSSPGVSEL